MFASAVMTVWFTVLNRPVKGKIIFEIFRSEKENWIFWNMYNGLKLTKVDPKWAPMHDSVQVGPTVQNDEAIKLERQN